MASNRYLNRALHAFGCAGIIGAFGCVTSVRKVEPGNAGLMNFFGNVHHKVYTPGLNIIYPFAKLEKVSLMTKNLLLNIAVSSNEGLPIEVSLDTIYRIQPEKCRDIFVKCLNKYEDILIKPYVQSALRDIISCYDAKALYHDKTRDEIKKKINDAIKSKLIENGIIVNDVLINNIVLPTQLVNAIKLKLETEQENERMNFTIEKERKQINFALEKETREAERKQIEATGIQKFQEIVSRGISKETLQWKQIEASLKLAESNNSKVVVLGGDSKNGNNVFFNL